MPHTKPTLAILALTVFVASSSPVFAQQQTLIKGDVDHGGFGGLAAKWTTVNDQQALLMGGRGGWIINHSFVLGAGGYGVVTDVDAPEGVFPGERAVDVRLGYGGFEMEYLIRPDSVAHLGIYSLIGGGSAMYVRDVGPVTESNQRVGASDTVFVFEPGGSAELNVTTWLRISGSLSYRLVRGMNPGHLTNGDLSGVAGTFTIKFGSF